MTHDKPETATVAANAVETRAEAAQRARARAQRGAPAPKRAGKAGVATKPARKPQRAKAKPDVGEGGRSNTKQAKLIAMLRAPDGATVAEAAKALGWQPHTARGALYGALKKRLGLNVTSEKVEGRGRVYRIAS